MANKYRLAAIIVTLLDLVAQATGICLIVGLLVVGLLNQEILKFITWSKWALYVTGSVCVLFQSYAAVKLTLAVRKGKEITGSHANAKIWIVINLVTVAFFVGALIADGKWIVLVAAIPARIIFMIVIGLYSRHLKAESTTEETGLEIVAHSSSTSPP